MENITDADLTGLLDGGYAWDYDCPHHGPHCVSYNCY